MVNGSKQTAPNVDRRSDDDAKNDLGPVVERGEVVLEVQNTAFRLVDEGLLLIVVD